MLGMELGEIISRVLKEDGRGLIHSIGRTRPGPMNAWIERRIFPGARPPAISQMMNIFEPNQLAVYDVENLRLHYAWTLEAWSERFKAHEEEITQMMDEEFVKAWGLYLDGSIAAFYSGQLQLFQVVFHRCSSRILPRSREYIYDDENTAGKAKLTVVSTEKDQ